MLKRTLCMLISLSMILGMICVYASPDVPSMDETKLSVLKGLDIVNGYESETKMLDKMSKSTFINFLLNMMYGGRFQAGYDEVALQMAADLKIIDNAASVSPADTLKGEEAIKMAMCLLGYRDLCLLSGGYPYGFRVKADQIDLTKGLSIKDEMSNAEAYKLLYNTMNVGIADIDAIVVHGDKYANYYTQYEDVTILNIYRNIYKVEGIVDANMTTGLYETAGTSDNCIKIDGTQYRDPDNLLFDAVGMKVRAFVHKEESGLHTLVYAESHEHTHITEFKTENISYISSDIRKIEYYPEDNAKGSKRANIKASVSLLYNGTVYSNYTAADFQTKSGIVTLIDNNDDNTIDVIRLDVYKNMLVSSVSASSEVINNEYTKDANVLRKLELKNYEGTGDVVKFFMDGKVAAFEDVMPGDVLSVFESKGTGAKSVIVHITRNAPIIDVTSCNTKAEEITAGDVTYKFSDTYKAAKTAGEDFAQAISAGKKYQVYLDMDDKIVAAKLYNDSGLSYGYLKAIAVIPGTFKSDYAVKLFGDDGKWRELYFKEKVKVGSSAGAEILTAQVAATRMQAAFVGDVIGYTLDKEGKINRIELPVPISGNLLDKSAVPNSDDRLIKTATNQKTYYYNNTSFESQHYMTADTKVIFIPSAEPDNEDLYDIGNNYSFVRETVTYTGYGCDEFGFLDLVLVERNSEQSKKVGSQLYFIRDFGFSLDSEGNSHPEITIASSTYYGLSLPLENAFLLANIKQGDIVRLHVNASGFVDRIDHVFDIAPAGATTREEILVGAITGDINSGAGQVKGFLRKADFTNERMLIESDRLQALKVSKTVPVLIYDARLRKVLSGTVYDLNIDDYVVVQISDAKVTGIYVVREL